VGVVVVALSFANRREVRERRQLWARCPLEVAYDLVVPQRRDGGCGGGDAAGVERWGSLPSQVEEASA
jgi:hypothetical protein